MKRSLCSIAEVVMLAVLAGGIAAHAVYAGDAPASPQFDPSGPRSGSNSGSPIDYDLAGNWVVINSEEVNSRAFGGTYDVHAGIPLNAAGLARAESFNEEETSLPELQCRRYLAPYTFRTAHPTLHIYDEFATIGDQKKLTETKIIAYVVHFTSNDSELGGERILYIDGRPAPPPLETHSFRGFSTGKWVGNVLYIQQTHLKTYYLLRPGVPASDRQTVIEHWVRHGDLLTMIQEVHDPVYLTEPYVRSGQWAYNSGPMVPEPMPFCIDTPELPSLTDHGHHVPSWLPGTPNPADQEVVTKYGVPLSVAVGSDGATMMYPEYRKRMKQHASSLAHCKNECNAVDSGFP